jgi:ATP-binding cassette subfamily F protein uup
MCFCWTSRLEESLLEFRGALVLVTHDRYMMDRVSTIVLGLDGLGEAERFADYSQWETWQRAQEAKVPSVPATRNAPRTAPVKKKLSYIEARELAAMEERIAEAERNLESKRAALEDPAIMSDGPRLLAASAELEEVRKTVDALYARWSELEQKQN